MGTTARGHTGWLLTTALLLSTAACTGPGSPASDAEDEPRAGEVTATRGTEVARPEVGACRALSPAAVEEPADDSPRVPCRRPHTAETFAVGRFEGRLAEREIHDARLSAEVLTACERRFRRYVGADDSLSMRTVLTWVWFRPTPAAWEAGARWYRCDLVAQGSEGLLETRGPAAGVLLGRPEDRWLLCAAGAEVSHAARVPCNEPHDWRAVTTVVVGDEREFWPGARRVEARTRDFCSDSVGGWLGYPLDYAYGWTWLGRAEWEAGNRRSVCWARTHR